MVFILSCAQQATKTILNVVMLVRREWTNPESTQTLIMAAKLCCTINAVTECMDCHDPICVDHFYKLRRSKETRCLKCFRKQILKHRTGRRISLSYPIGSSLSKD